MKCITWVLLSILPLHLGTMAQGGHYLSGARSRGISGTSTTISDAFASMNNIGALAAYKKRSCFFTGSLLYGIPGLKKIAAGFNSRLLSGVATVNFFRLGDQWFSENKAGLGFSHTIRFISLGLQLNYVQYRMHVYGSSGFLGVEMGGLIKISSSFFFGAYIFNPILARDKNDRGSLSQTLLKSGFSYRPAEQLMLNLECQYYLSGQPYLLVGFEYVILDKFALRTGFAIETLKSSFGFGFTSESVILDYAFDMHPLLGWSHEVSVNIQIGRGR